LDIEGRRRPTRRSSLDEATLRRVTRRGVAEIIEESEFIQLLQAGEPLRLKMGFDPSAPDIHLGHVVGLRKLRQLQELGHQVLLIVGDWTALIGDPSGQSATRPMLSRQEVESNAQTYLRQFFKVVDEGRTKVLWQSEWFGKFTLEDVIRLAARFTVAQFLQREDFRQRWDTQRPIAITELLYPLLQAYDSVAIKADVEFGGTDQKFNLLLGRELQVMMGQRPQQCFLVPLLVGTSGGRKMSKSLGNYIAVEEPPQEQYGKVMSLPDELVLPYFDLLTDVPEPELVETQEALRQGRVNPMEMKKRLAREIVGQFWGAEAVLKAEEGFERVVQRREAPEDVATVQFSRYANPSSGAPEYRFFLPDHPEPVRVAEPITSGAIFALGLAPSRSEAKRLVVQGAVEVDGQQVGEELPTFRDGTVVRVGKRRFLRLVEAQHPNPLPSRERG
jgi:tyrosyl-tRNA synthetase